MEEQTVLGWMVSTWLKLGAGRLTLLLELEAV